MKKLFKISLIISLIGIYFLLFLINFLPIKEIKINKINDFLINKKIQINVEIMNIKDMGDFKIISVQDKTGEIKALCNCNKDIGLKINQSVIIIGKVQEYKNNLQISTEKIIL